MKKKLTAMVLALGAMFGACADTEFANGYTWNYRIRDGKEAILYAYSPNSDRPSAISPSPTGHVTVPSYLGGKPLVEIGGDSFLKCGGLTGVTIPSSVRSIGDSAFGLCTGLVSVTIPSSVTNIGVGAFIETGLRHVVVPDSVTSIGGSAFGACPNLESAEIGNGATMLPTHIFYNDEKLQSVTIGRNVRSVDSWAFLNCSNLTSIAVSPESPYLKSESGLLLTKDGKTLVVGVNMNGDVVVPNGVTNIADMAFYHRTGVTGVLLPAGLKAIGERAFSGCSNLSGISIPESVESILFAAFGYCPLITSVNIPDGVQFVAPCLFEECFSLKSIRIGVGVTNIGYSAFSCCTNLVDVEICGPVKSIDFEAFALCLSLSSLSLPAELENIGECAFISCNGLKDLLFHGDAPTVGEFAFADFDWNTEMLFPLTNCIVSVRRGTTGWGEVPGEWNGMQTQYLATFVTYDENWAGGTKTKKELSDGDGILANAPADPKREGWYFCGWFTESEGGVKVTGETVVKGDATYYAQWGKPVATFAAGAVSSSESKTVKLTVFGGSLTGPSSVKVFMTYQTAAAADLDFANATVNGVKVKGGLKFPLTLSWDTADVTPYTIEIPLKGDKTVEDDEAVTFQLADVIGTEMGETDVCTVTVKDPAFDELRGRIETGTATKAESNNWIKVSHDGIPYFCGLPYPADGGKATGSGYCPAGKKVTLKASANKGWKFLGWTCGGRGATALPDDGDGRAGSPLPADEDGFVATTPSLVIDRTAKPAKDTKTSTTISNLTESTTFYAVFEGDARVTATPVAFTEEGGVVASEGGKITGAGRYAPGKKVTLKATANKGFVFGGWYAANGKLRMENGKLIEDEGAAPSSAAEAAPLSQAASFSFEMGEEDVDLYARFVTAGEDAGSIVATLNGAAMSSSPDGSPAITTNVWCGVYLAWPLASEALSQTTIKVAGLPAGLKFTAKDIVDSKTKQVTVPANTIYGAPTAASKMDKNGKPVPSNVKVTVTTAGKSSVTYVIALTVDALPAWAVGNFDGCVGNGESGTVALTIAASGKISGKILEGGRTWSLSAASFDEAVGPKSEVDSLVFTATVIAKAGKEVATNVVEVAAGTRDACPYQCGVATGTFNAQLSTLNSQLSTYTWTAYQNLWKRADTKAAQPVFKKNVVVEYYPLGVAGDKNNTVKFTFKKDGVVSFSGKVGGVSVSGSAQLVWVSGALGESALPDGWYMTIYVPPKPTAKPPFAGWCETFPVKLTMDEQNIVTAVELGGEEPEMVQLWEGGPYWATKNIGAEKPEDYGYYFWWGDTIGYKWENEQWVASDGSVSGFSFSGANPPTYGKDLATLQSEGRIISKDDTYVLAPEHDAAQVHWGGNWRMPTDRELGDLCDKCDWAWTTLNGERGLVVRGRGAYALASIFLPIAGSGRGDRRDEFSNGYFWASVPYPDDDDNAMRLRTSKDAHYVAQDYRSYGYSIRPVQSSAE